MSNIIFPTSAAELNVAVLTSLIGANIPGAGVRDFNVVEVKLYGDGMVSTAGRMVLDLEYTPSSPSDLPRRVVLKVARDDGRFVKSLYANEVEVYNRLRPFEDMEAPRSLGGAYDPQSATFALILEDLRQREAIFPNVTTEIKLVQIRNLLDLLAKLHAKYWQTPRFETDLAWLQTHLKGEVHEFFTNPEALPAIIASEAVNERFKREMLERMGETAQTLHAAYKLAQQHQSRLPQTIVHGDSHIGNTYLLPGNRCGLLDWQLTVRGYCLHDTGYLLATGLTIEMRRKHERELLKYYLEQLSRNGVANTPSFDEAWLEYRRTAIWNVYIGWLTTPVTNYGWEICVLSHLRVMTAFEDLETGKLIEAMR
jgi:hypothetical protein